MAVKEKKSASFQNKGHVKKVFARFHLPGNITKELTTSKPDVASIIRVIREFFDLEFVEKGGGGELILTTEYGKQGESWFLPEKERIRIEISQIYGLEINIEISPD